MTYWIVILGEPGEDESTILSAEGLPLLFEDRHAAEDTIDHLDEPGEFSVAVAPEGMHGIVIA